MKLLTLDDSYTVKRSTFRLRRHAVVTGENRLAPALQPEIWIRRYYSPLGESFRVTLLVRTLSIEIEVVI